MEKRLKLNGVVGAEILTSAIEQQIAEMKLSPDDTLVVEVNSPGGSVTEGFSLYNLFNNLNCTVVFDITGVAMSIMSLIILAGDRITSSPVSLLMIHKASTGLEGNADEMRKQAAILDKIDSILIELYYQRNQDKGTVKLDRTQLETMLSGETFMGPDEALSYGFVDEVIGNADLKIAAQMKDLIFTNKSQMKHLEKLRRLLAMSDRPKVEEQAIKDAFVKALGEKDYSALSDEEKAEVNSEVQAAITEIVGDTLTEQEAAQVVAAVEAAVEEMTAATADPDPEPDPEMQAIRDQIEALKELVMTAANSNVELAETITGEVSDLKDEIVALKKGTRSFSKKPFTNETTKVNFGGQYIDPYAKHRKEMAEIEARTRQAKNKNV